MTKSNIPTPKKRIKPKVAVRNRHYCNDVLALSLLEEAHGVGIHIDYLKRLSMEARNWTDWRNTLESWIDEGPVE